MVITTTMGVSALTLTPPSTPDIRIIQDAKILSERLPRQPQEKKQVEERSKEQIMITPPTTPPPPTVECDDLSTVELEETAIEKLEKIKSLPIPALENAVSALKKALGTLPSLLISDSSLASLSSSSSSSSPLSNPQEIANHHSLIAASFSSFAFALGHSLSALSTCDIALEELSSFSSTAITPILTTHLATKSKLLNDVDILDTDLSDARTEEATILADLKASAHAVGETQGRLEEIRCRINVLAERLGHVADRRREAEERRDRILNRSGSSDTIRPPPPVAIGFLSALIAPVALAAGAFSVNTRATDAELKRLTDQSVLLQSQISALNPALLEKSLHDLLRGHTEQHEKLMAMQTHVFTLENTRAEIHRNVSDVEARIKDVNGIIGRVGEAMNRVAALRERTMKIVALVGCAKVGVLNLLVCACPPLSAAATGNFSTVRAVVRRIVAGWVDTFGSSAGEEESLQELIKIYGKNEEKEEEEGEEAQNPEIFKDDNIDQEQENEEIESTDQIVADSHSE